jgi:protein-tyrosine phosphatase
MAEGLMRSRLAERGREDIEVGSMGISGLDHKPASSYAVIVAKQYGIDLGEHRSRPLNHEEVLEAHLVFTMDSIQKDFLTMMLPQMRDRVFLLGAWPDRATRKSAIRDPMGKRKDVYERVFKDILRHIERIIPLIVSMYPLED